MNLSGIHVSNIENDCQSGRLICDIEEHCDVNYFVKRDALYGECARNGIIQIINLHDGYYQVVFTTHDDYNFALFEGPWMVVDHYLIVQRWLPFFLTNVEKMKNVAVWLKVQCLPIELYNDVFLKRIGMSLRKSLKADKLTSIQSRGKYARICMELDLYKPLESHIYVRVHKLNL
ncbi:hypothetical protein GmHk_15G045021 [Glycine max]|uniref:DUF4283 domain-containing protein n=1 Tax=Glycine max TaxID=3847 RepID=A0A0R0GFA3_SOYBN|nr:hypothetical protein GmHk_15G045021 [Glycine max]